MNGFIVAKSRVATIANRHGEFGLQAFIADDGRGHLATILVINRGEPARGMLVRLNSGCVTSEVFGDTSCDCAWQLTEAMRMIGEAGSGLVIHSAHHEGRGAGIFEKINSMAEMRATDCSSSEAFSRIGVQVDSRDFSHSVIVLRHLGVSELTLLSNNAAKLRALQSAGIHVRGSVPVVALHMRGYSQYIAGKGVEPIRAQ